MALCLQAKSQCFYVRSILVDACDGGNEGQNEMVIFKVGSTPLNSANLTVNWPNNSWLGLCQSATTASNVATINSTIQGCGYLIEPTGGVLPANSQVLLITSTAFNPLAQSFVNLSDTLYVIFQCAGNTSGHFANYGTGIRTLTMSFSSPASCSNVVSYDRSLLLNQSQVPGAQDGGAVEYDAAGNPTYVNHGCAVPAPPLSVDAGPNQTICRTSTAALTATYVGNYNSLAWSLGSGATGSFSSPGSVSTTYTPGAGDANTIKLYCTVLKSCPGHTVTAKDSMNITLQQVPQPVISSTASAICSGSATVLSYSLSNAGTTGTTSVQWLPSNATTSTISVNAPGTYSVKITDACGNSTAAFTVSALPSPSVSITAGGPTQFCSGGSVLLTATSNAGNYQWSTGATTATLNVNSTYTAIVTSTNSCGSASATQTVVANPIPTVTATSPQTLTCTSSTVSLSGTGGGTYSWSGPGIVSGGNTATPVVNQPGSYTVLVTASGCTNTAVASVAQNASLPVVFASPSSSLNCTNTTAQAIASTTATPVSYAWTGPGIVSGASTASATVNAGGTYNYTVTNTSNGCKATGSIAIAQNTVQPSANASTGSIITCTSNAVALSSSPGSGVTYTWSAAAGSTLSSGINTSTATAQGPGPYTVTIKDNSNGCVNTATAAPSTNTTVITPTIAPAPVLSCSSQTVSLSGSPASSVSYSWSGPGVVPPSNLSSVSVNSPGNYVLTVTNQANGCTGSSTMAVTQNTTAPTVTVSPTQTITCASPSVTISGSASPGTATASWAGVCGSATSFTTTACATGTFVLTVTDPANGCSATGSVAVVSSNGLPQVTASSNGSITCSNTSVQVAATTTSSPVSYSWSGPGSITSPASATTAVNAGGTYTCVVTNTSNGCASTITTFVPTNTTPVSVTVSPSASITCAVTTQTLNASPTGNPYAFNWSGTGITSGGNTPNPVVNAGGNFVITVTNTVTGCTGTNTVVVPQDNALPTLTISPNTFTVSCATPTVQLTANASVSTVNYSWTSNPNGALSSTSVQNPVASVGSFSAVVTNTVNGCVSAPATATVFANASVPTVSLSASNVSITCSNSSPSVTVTSTVSTLSYSWSPAPANGINTNTPVFSQPGTYSCIVTNTTNGCSTTANVTVSSNTTVPVISGPATQTLTCSSPSVVLQPTITPSAGLSYTWTGTGISGPANSSSVTVTQAGTYSLTVLNAATGCSATATSSVTSIAGIPNATISPAGTATIISCAQPSLVLIATTNPANNISYTWSTGSSANSSTVTSAGVITVTVTNSVSNCSTTVQYTVTSNTNPPGISSANGVFPCGAASTSLLASSTDTNASYAWSGPASGIISGGNTSTPTIGSPGIYTVTATDNGSGCSSSATVAVTQATVNASFSANPNTGVAPLPVHFTNTSSGATAYQWSFGDSNGASSQDADNTYSASGTYTVMLVASSGGCSDTAYAVIIVDAGMTINIPNVFTPNGDGVNDAFDIKSTGVKEMTLNIYNRWGQKLYEFTGPKATWDGRTVNGEHAPDGTYFFFLKASGFDDKTIEQHGTLSLFN